MTPDLLVTLVAHEVYPGIHTEHSWKEQLHVREGGRLEESALMVGTLALIGEGIAELASEILGDERERVTAAHVEGTGGPVRPRSLSAVNEAEEEPIDVRR